MNFSLQEGEQIGSFRVGFSKNFFDELHGMVITLKTGSSGYNFCDLSPIFTMYSNRLDESLVLWWSPHYFWFPHQNLCFLMLCLFNSFPTHCGFTNSNITFGVRLAAKWFESDGRLRTCWLFLHHHNFLNLERLLLLRLLLTFFFLFLQCLHQYLLLPFQFFDWFMTQYLIVD